MQDGSNSEVPLWPLTAEAGASLHSLLAHRPELRQKYLAFVQSFYQSDVLPRRVLELMRVKIAQVHGLAIRQQDLDPLADIDDADIDALSADQMELFTPSERDALSVADLIPMQPHGLTDELVGRVAASFSAKGCVMLLVAASFFDVNMRLSMVFGQPHALSRFDLEEVH